MKICFLYESVFTLGGIQSCITMLSNYLVSKNYDVSIICTKDEEKIDRSKYGLSPKVNIIFIKKPNFFRFIMNIGLKILKRLNHTIGFLNNKEKILKSIYCFYEGKEVERIINNEKFDVIISSGVDYNTMLALLNIDSSIKKIGWQHNSYEEYFTTSDRNYWKQDAIVKKMFENLDRYVVLTEVDRKKLEEQKGYKAITIYNPTRFTLDNLSKLDSKKMIAVGRLHRAKGFDILINNFYEFNKENKEWTLDIYGEGPERKKLQNLVNKLHLENYVKINGRTNNIKEKYQNASIYCMASRVEGLPMVILEAMASGLPILAYELPCINEIIADNGGVIVPKGNSKKYVESMLELANSKEKREESAKLEIQKIKEFFIEEIGKKWENLLQDVIKEQKNEKSIGDNVNL